MKFQEIPFTNSEAKEIYLNYLQRVKNSIKSLSAEQQNETLMEINSHLFEAISISEQDEKQRIILATKNLGTPEVFLRDLVAEKQLEEAVKSFNPIKIIKALFLNLSNGIAYVIFFILYLSLFSFVFLIFAKIFDPKHVGLFYRNPDIFVLGKISSDNTSYLQYEQLGNWFIPLMLVCIIVFYLLLTLGLRFKRAINKK